MNLDSSLRTAALLKCLIIPDEQEKFVSTTLTYYKLSSGQLIDPAQITAYIHERNMESSSLFKKNTTSFESIIKTKKETYAFFSVPYDSFWKATVNDMEVSIMNTNGFMAVPLEKGINRIQFHYFDKYLILGFIMSSLSFITLIIYVKKFRINKIETED